MKIPLDLIQPSPQPVRTTWDEEKMEELAQSIREQGVIVPIKVRPVAEWIANCPSMQDARWPMFCTERQQLAIEKYGYDGAENGPGLCPWCAYADGDPDINTWEDDDEEPAVPEDWKPYEIVYGHRRVEAARRAGLDEIEAVMEYTKDDETIIQALIENVQREDMQPQDELDACEAIMRATSMGWEDLWRNGILPYSRVLLLRQIANLPQDIKPLVGSASDDKPLKLSHIEFAGRTGVGGEGGKPDQQAALREQKAAVLRKVASEGLSVKETQRVAAAVAAAPTEEAKKRLLEWQYSPVIHDPDLIRARAKEYGAHDPMYRDTTPKKTDEWQETPEVKAVIQGVIESAKRWNDLIKVVQQMADIGKMSPESRQFVAHRARSLAQTLAAWADELEVKAHAN